MFKNLFSRLIDFIESENFVYSCTLAILLVQTFISASLFHRVSNLDFSFDLYGYHITVLEWLHAFAFAFAIESAVLMLIVNAKKQGAIFYALGSFLCCMLYFRDWEHLVYGGWYEKLPSILATTIYSLMISCSVFYFSDLFAAKLAARKQRKAIRPTIPEQIIGKAILAEEQKAEAKKQTQRANELITQKLTEQNSIPEQVATEQTEIYNCPECSRTFATQKALNGHMKAHNRELITI